MLDAGSAFGYVSCGIPSETAMSNYSEHVNNTLNNFKKLGGWFERTANRVKEGHDRFINSRIWELGKRLNENHRNRFIGAFDIGYLNTIESQSEAQGLMRNYIMANPNVMTSYLDGKIEGYNGDFTCSGVGSVNPFYRQAVNGIIMKTEDGYERTNYILPSHYNLSFHDKINILSTWESSNRFLMKDIFTFTG